MIIGETDRMEEPEIQHLTQENGTGRGSGDYLPIIQTFSGVHHQHLVQRLQGLILTPIYTNLTYLPELSEYSNYDWFILLLLL